MIPYKFQGGTKAKAEEINTNFTSLDEAINRNLEAVSNLELLVNSKANQNGDMSQAFVVAEANNPLEAPNLQQVRQIVSMAIQGIQGMNLSMDGINIRVNPGVCYDSSYKYIINLANQNTITIPDTDGTYYIYVTWDINNPNATPTITYSSNNISPVLVNDTTVYRKIGKFSKTGFQQVTSLVEIGTRISEDEEHNVL